jgi:ligand-binding SRPBCC domain-containing protein
MRNFIAEPILESITISAPIARCFALSTNIALVQRTIGMKLIDSGEPGGVTTGHIAANSRVVWRGWKFGLPIEHHTLVTAFEPPHPGSDGQLTAYFEDSQEHGRFASFRHEHFLIQLGCKTELEDRIHFALPFGPLGRLAAKLLLEPYIRKQARQRFAMIKELAEGEGWSEWIEPPV